MRGSQKNKSRKKRGIGENANERGEREKRENTGEERGGGGSEKAAREPHMEVIL